jgi:hypothetical protein
MTLWARFRSWLGANVEALADEERDGHGAAV